MQRVGWPLTLLIVVAAILGAFGTSPLAGRVVAVDQDGAHYEVEYPRITRHQHLDRLHVRVHAPDAQGDEPVIAFSNHFLEITRLGSNSPEPDGGGAGADGGFDSFNVTDWLRPIVITIEMEPR